jgi:phage terminase large subunit-like protein
MDDINTNWHLLAQPHQTPPDVAPNGKPWLTWLLIGGRGAGKTRAGARRRSRLKWPRGSRWSARPNTMSAR